MKHAAFHKASWVPARRNVSPQPTEHTTSAKTSPQREEQKVVYVAAHSSIQLWPIILTLIKFNPGPFPFHFSASCCIHTPKTRGQLWKGDQIQHNYGNGLPFSPSPPHRISPPPPLPPSLLPPSLSLPVSLSPTPWRHVKCAQISVMGWEFITFTLRPFMRSHPGEVCLPECSAAQ